MSSLSFDPQELQAHTEGLRRLARRLLGDDFQAEDVVQQTMVRAMEKPPLMDRPLWPWLSVVARNLAFDLRRKEKRRTAREALRAAEGEALSPESLVGRTEAHRNAIDALLRLAEPYRETLLLRFLEDLSSPEIAARQEVPAATVRTRVKRGLEMLRNQLKASQGSEWKNQCRLLVSAPAVEGQPVITRSSFWPALLVGLVVIAGGVAFMVFSSNSDSETQSIENELLIDERPDADALMELGYSGD